MIHLTARSLDTLVIELGAAVASERAGLVIPASVNGATIELGMMRPDHLSSRPQLIAINGVTYEMSWWATRDGNPHARPTASGWKDRSLRLQRLGSTAIRDYTPAAFRLGCRLQDALIDAVAADAALIRQATVVEALREVTAAEREYERALRELENAESRLRGAEGWLDVLEGRPEAAMPEAAMPEALPEAALPALVAG